MKLVTRRMTLIAMEPQQLAMLARKDISALEKDITLTYRAEPLEGNYRDTVVKSAELIENDEDNYLWHTLWMFNLGRELIGSGHFKGLPGKDGTVEISYGLNKDFWGEGYATEAVGKLVEWALRQPEAVRVVAETPKNNAASQRVLVKNGFVKYRETESYIYYSKE